jgi:predicted amidohydrolase YtcJ
VISDRPVYVLERDGHMGLANTKALQLAGITRDTKDPPNGHIMRDANGEPTGELRKLRNPWSGDAFRARRPRTLTKAS